MNRTPLNILLALLCLGLGAGVWQLVTRPAPAAAVAVPAPDERPETVRRLTLPRPQPERYAAIADRPLFSPDRRLPAVAPAAPRARAPAPDFALSGVVTRGESRRALLGVDGRSPVLVGAGDAIEGWTVTAIEGGVVALVRDGRSLEVGMDGMVETSAPDAGADAATPAARRAAAPVPGPAGAARRATGTGGRTARSFGFDPDVYDDPDRDPDD